MKLSVAGARALHLAAQGLTTPPAHGAEKADVLATIRRMGGLQIDTISVVARSPYLVLWSRLGAYEPRWLDELLAEGALFEYWSHAACFLPLEDFPYYRRRMIDWGGGDAVFESGTEEHRSAVQHVLERIREQGAVRSAEFTRTDGQAGGWWNWKPEKLALERLFNAGVLMIARREGFQRVYDLRERVLPDWDDRRTPDRTEMLRVMALRAVRCLGVATPNWVSGYFQSIFRRGTHIREVAALLARLSGEDELLPVELEVAAPAYIHRDDQAAAEAAEAGGLVSTVTTLLSPFDPVTRDRGRARSLFGFDYTIETYTPAPKRRYGYFTLPILHRGALVGRLDPKAHRKQGIFEVKAIHLEAGVEVTDELVTALAETLRACADWHRTPEVVVRRSDPPELAERLARVVSRCVAGV